MTRYNQSFIAKLRYWWGIFNPPLVEREFVRQVGSFWLRRHGYMPHVNIGLIYTGDFVSTRRKRIIYVIDRQKQSRDIVRLQQRREFENHREEYLNRNGWAVMYVQAEEVFTDGEEMAKLVKEWHKDPGKFND